MVLPSMSLRVVVPFVVCGLWTCLTTSAHHLVDSLKTCWTVLRVSGRGSWRRSSRGWRDTSVPSQVTRKWVSSTVTIFPAHAETLAGDHNDAVPGDLPLDADRHGRVGDPGAAEPRPVFGGNG
jgi:hypothetical protein